MAKVPTLRSVTLTDADTNYNLYDLLHALDATIPKRCQMVQIQWDSAAGAELLYIGDSSSLSATDRGVELVGTQAFTIQSVDSNLIMLTDIYLRSSGAGLKANIAVVVR